MSSRRNKHQLKLEHRRRRAREHLPELMRATGGLCYWCREPISMRRTIEDHEIVKLTPRAIRWRDTDGMELFALLASVDHVQPFEDGGGNHRTNLVAACTTCNNRRSRLPGTGNVERAQARIYDEHQEAQELRPLFKWLRRVNGTLTFGKEIRCVVKSDDGAITADYKHTDIVKVVRETQRIYNGELLKKLGKSVAHPFVTKGGASSPAIDPRVTDEDVLG